MSPQSLVRTLVSSTALAVATAASVTAQTDVPATLGVVRGTVYDSTAQAPLADAAVFLWNTPYRAVTDEDGGFLITDVPSGVHAGL